MTGILLRVVGLMGLYLLVLTSISPGDVLVGGLLALGIVIATGSHGPRHGAERLSTWAVALAGMVLTTAAEMVVGSVRVVRFCLGGPGNPGFVEIPRADRSRRAVALWGVLTGEAPDEYPVDVDETRHVLIVHLVDAGNPDAIRARHAAARDRWQRHVVP